VNGEESQRAAYTGAMAELVAHIAHEVNQPLAAISATANACMRWLGAAPPNIDEACLAAERIARDARRASDVIGDLRTFLSQPGEERITVSLNEQADACVARFAGTARRHGVALVVDPAEGDLHATVRGGAIALALDELVANAIEACIEASASREVRVRVRGPERGAAVIVVEDTGPGFRAEELQRLFEPLFSTKPRRLGLGLALVRSTFEQHGGRILAQRGADGVTRFMATLPLEPEPA
jgi:signal transduction histidine kinase